VPTDTLSKTSVTVGDEPAIRLWSPVLDGTAIPRHPFQPMPRR
jgi:hypothetical protein